VLTDPTLPITDVHATVKAGVEIPQGGAEGMLITLGGRFGAYGFYLPKHKPVFPGTWST
jgi:hypothetical protein